MNDKHHILVVDDILSNARFIKAMLVKANCEVVISQTGMDAIQQARSNHFTLILLDIVLPDILGIEVCSHLKSSPDFDTPIIFISAQSQQSDIIKGLRAGAVDYLIKPFSPEEFLARVSIHLKLRQKTLLLERSNQNLLAILNQLSIGSVIINAEQKLEFISDSCCYLLNEAKKDLIGKPWQQAINLETISQKRLQAYLAMPQDRYERISLNASKNNKNFHLDAEIRIDPQNPQQHIVYFYDISEIHRLRQQLHNTFNMIGHSPAMQTLFRSIEQVAKGDWSVLIEGETGTGKELTARAIHNNSARKDAPFIALNCAGLNESLLASQLFGHKRGAFTGAQSDHIGFFEAAKGGTLFLDEIGDIPMTMQTHLLRVLQEHEITRVGETQTRKVDVRILAATHKDLNQEVTAERFREDLLYRIRVARVHVPALRERVEDIVLLSNVFLEQSALSADKKELKFTAKALTLLKNHQWRGNVRELKSCIDYAVIYCQNNEVLAEDLPPELHNLPLLENDERQRFLMALKQTQNNRSKAAKLLGISRATFYRRLHELNLEPD